MPLAAQKKQVYCILGITSLISTHYCPQIQKHPNILKRQEHNQTHIIEGMAGSGETKVEEDK